MESLFEVQNVSRKAEKILSQARVFNWPGKKRHQNSDLDIDVVVIDVTETQIERPKKQKQFFRATFK